MKNHELDREMRKDRWRARHNMRWSWRAGFLILASGFAPNVHWFLIAMTLIGYQVCETDAESVNPARWLFTLQTGEMFYLVRPDSR